MTDKPFDHVEYIWERLRQTTPGATKCPGHLRHWFTGKPGMPRLTCSRCGAPNPRLKKYLS